MKLFTKGHKDETDVLSYMDIVEENENNDSEKENKTMKKMNKKTVIGLGVAGLALLGGAIYAGCKVHESKKGNNFVDLDESDEDTNDFYDDDIADDFDTDVEEPEEEVKVEEPTTEE